MLIRNMTGPCTECSVIIFAVFTLLSTAVIHGAIYLRSNCMLLITTNQIRGVQMLRKPQKIKIDDTICPYKQPAMI